MMSDDALTRERRPLTDDELVARVRGGDDRAFSEIHHRFSAQLNVFARRILRASARDAEDVVQEAFIRAYIGLRATAGPIALRPWLYAIVHNRALDELRRHRVDVVPCDAQLPAAPSCDPQERLAGHEELRDLVAAITRLPERQPLALVMREFDGRSHAETAKALQTTSPATKALIVRARITLRSGMRQAGSDGDFQTRISVLWRGSTRYGPTEEVPR